MVRNTVYSPEDLCNRIATGIPFAEPPIGQFRLRKPILKTRLATPSFNASAYGKSCVQPVSFLLYLCLN